MQLSKHFALAEFTVSQTAVRLGIDNTPPDDVLARLMIVARKMEEVRSALESRVITISSGYRSPALNKRVGGAKNSAHVEGWAVDFNCHGFGSPLAVARQIAKSGIEFDQLIHEFGSWVHISFDPRNRRQLLTVGKHGTVGGLYPV